VTKTVLVVDDDDDIRAALAECITSAGYHCVTAEGGRRAVELLEGILRPCVVLLDYSMHGGDGEYFLRAIEALADREHFKVVVMSGMRGLSFDYSTRVVRSLDKPFDLSALLAVVQEHCGSSEQPAEGATV
jgi:DNA-binding NtrC family response regulator